MNADSRAPSVSELLLLAVAAAPYVVWYTGTIYDPTEPPQRAFLTLAAAAVFLFAALRARKTRPEVLLTPWHLAAAALLAWAAMTGSWSRSKLEWAYEFRHWALAGAFGAMAAAARGRVRPWAVAALFAAGAAQAAVCVLQYFGVPPFSWILQSVAPGGTLGHRSFAIHFLVLTMPLGAALWARASRPASFWAITVPLGLFAGTFLLASARAGWVAAALETALLGTWLALESRGRGLPGSGTARAASLAGGAAVALLLAASARGDYTAAYGTYGDRLSAIVTGLSGAPNEAPEGGVAIPVNNVRMRLAIWRNSRAIFEKRPFRGVGLGNFQVHYPWFSRSVAHDGVNVEHLVVDHAHNDPIEYLLETGAMGALLALAVAFLTFRAAAKRLRSEDPWDRALSAALAGSLCGILANSLFCLPAHRAVPPFAAALFMGLLAGRWGAGRPLAIAPAAARAAGAFGVFLVALAIADGARRLQAQRFFGRATGSLKVLAAHTDAPEGMAKEEWARRQAAVLASALADAQAAAGLSKDPKFLYSMGSLLARMGRWDDALYVLAPFTEARPNHFRALIQLALVLHAKERFQEAAQVAGRAANIRPESVRAQQALGLSLMGQGRPAEAAEAFRRASALEPRNPVPRLRLGNALARAGDIAGARAALQKAVELDAGLTEAREGLRRLLEPRGQSGPGLR